MKQKPYLAILLAALVLSACGDGTDVPTSPTAIGTVDYAECTTEGVCTEVEKASWLAVKRAQCLRLGGAYCR